MPSPAKSDRSVRKKIVFSLVPALLGLGAIEAALWLFAPLPDPYPGRRFHQYLPSWNWGRREPPFEFFFDSGPLHGVNSQPKPIAVNRYGFFYPAEKEFRKSEDELRIAVVGGSIVECMVLNQEERLTAVLERQLETRFPDRDVTVLNLGLSARNTLMHVATTAQHITTLDLDCVVFPLGANDAMTGEEYTPMLDERCFIDREISRNFVRIVSSRTQLGRRLRHMKQNRRDRQRDTPYFQKQLNRVFKAPVTTEKLRIPQAGLDQFERNVVTLAAICEAHGIKVLFATTPMLYSDDMGEEELAVCWMRGAFRDGTFYQLAPEVAGHAVSAYNQHLIDVCTARGYHVLDLAGRVPHSLDYFYDDFHYNKNGAAYVAELVAQELDATGWFSDDAPGSSRAFGEPVMGDR